MAVDKDGLLRSIQFQSTPFDSSDPSWVFMLYEGFRQFENPSFVSVDSSSSVRKPPEEFQSRGGAEHSGWKGQYGTIGESICVFHFMGGMRYSFKAICPDLKTAKELREFIRKFYPPIPVSEKDNVLMSFWHMTTNRGIASFNKRIVVPPWDKILGNYPDKLVKKYGPVVAWKQPPDGAGRLILMHGDPGVGKTYAIRAMAWEWRKWAKFHYIVDPENLFGEPSYLLTLMSDIADDDDTIDAGKHNILILEDTGELLAQDAKQRTGQGLSRLLNLVDGIMGQGTNLLVLITTNESISTLHPAVSRPGRCLANFNFPTFSAEEAAEWFKAKGIINKVHKSRTLAEMYAEAENRTQLNEDERRVGF